MTTPTRQQTERGSPGAAARPSEQAPPRGEPGGAWRHHDVLDLDDFSRAEIDAVLDIAERMREILDRRIARVPALRGFTVVNLFYEPSTRTRASFELAGKVLGADVIGLSASTSSVQKGESLIDTVRTLRAMSADAIVIRHASAGVPYLAAEHTDASIINAGDGAHAHPTQALLDLYTIRRHVGDLAGKRVAMVGDISHSRVARSDLWGLAAMGARVVVCGPPTLLPRGFRPGERPFARRGGAATGDGGDRRRPRHRGRARGDGACDSRASVSREGCSLRSTSTRRTTRSPPSGWRERTPTTCSCTRDPRTRASRSPAT